MPGRHPSGDAKLRDGYTSELSEQDNNRVVDEGSVYRFSVAYR